MKCSACKGMYHPATGNAWTKNLVLCRGCTLDFVRWLKGREIQFSRPWKRPPSKMSFIDAALTSIGRRK